MPRQSQPKEKREKHVSKPVFSAPMDCDTPMQPVYGVPFSDMTRVMQPEGLYAVASRTSDDATGEGVLDDLHNVLKKYQEFLRRTEYTLAQTRSVGPIGVLDENVRMPTPCSGHRLHHNPFATNSEGSLGTDSYLGNPSKTIDNSILIAGILYFRFEYCKTFLAHHAHHYTRTSDFMSEEDYNEIRRVARPPQDMDALVGEIMQTQVDPTPGREDASLSFSSSSSSSSSRFPPSSSRPE